MSIATARPTDQKCGVVYKGRPPCKQPAGKGTDHLGVGPCKYHGGNLPVVQEARAKEIADFRANRALAEFGKPLADADPEEVLLGLVAEAAGNVAWLGAQVARLAADADPDAEQPQPVGRRGNLWSGTVAYPKGGNLFGPVIDVDKDGREHIIGEDQRAMVKLYGQWADRLAKYAKAALDAGIEKRRVEMAERQGETIVVVVQNVLVGLGLPDDVLQQARTMVAAEFRRLGTGEPA